MGKAKKSRSEFLDDDCGQNALQLAARGSTIISEMLRLSEHIPNVFKEPEKSPEYAKIIADFKYFQGQDAFEKAIQDSAELLQRDDEFRQTHFELLDRFFKLFRGVYGYVTELNRFIEEIKEGLYISQSLESILINQDGKQLLCEVFYLYGVMLLLLDYKIGGKVREYLIVSYIRYKGAGEQNTVEISSMCRNTGYLYDRPLPEQYPVAYFNRIPIDKEVVGLLIGRIRSDDIYQMSYNYPAPEHRSTALSMQASILYVLLFFRPEILQHERPVMREIVDKHFADNWIINYYLGFTVDLIVAWKDFKAASIAIDGTVNLDTISYHQLQRRDKLKALNKQIVDVLREGVLTEQYVLDNIHSSILPKIRDANVCLRWFILHMTRGPSGRRYFESYKKTYEHITADITTDDVLTLLLQTAQLEFTLKAMFEKFLKEKKGKWVAAKEQGVSKMSKLASFFSGEHVLSDNVRVAQFESWFTDMAARIESLEYNDSTTASRRIQKLMKALEGVQEFSQIDSNLQVVQFLHETRHLLRQMIRYINIERKVLITISTVGDLSYAWELMSTHQCFVPEIQDKIKRNPHLAIQMRSAFVKLATMLELPCNRIDQAAGNDALLSSSLESVSEYYSTELVVFVRKVLHIIPISIFGVLNKIVSILVNSLKECPTKLARKDLKAQCQLDVRHQLASHTADISKFASGILAMESTLVGVIQVDPHRLLEDGIRKELTRQISLELHKSLKFDPKAPLSAEELDRQLEALAKQLHGIQASFEYIQDYLNVHGLRIWIEEFSRIVNFNVDMETNSFMQKKIYHWNSKYQSDSIPIPYFEKESEKETYSILGRLVQHILALTDPRRSMYVPALGSWYETAASKEVLGTRTFTSITSAVGTTGLSALDRLFCFLVARDLQVSIAGIRRHVEPLADVILHKVQAQLSPPSSCPSHVFKIYEAIIAPSDKALVEIGEILIRVGRIQLTRNLIASELRSCAKLNSGSLFNTLSTANTALLADLNRHYSKPLEHQMPGDIIAEICPFLDNVGLSDAQSKVYVTSKPIPEIPLVLVAMLIRNLGRVTWDERLSALVTKKKEDPFDAAPFAFGVMLLLKQFHTDMRELFFSHVSQLVRSMVTDFEGAEPKVRDREVLPEGAENVMHFANLLATACGGSMEELHRTVPPQLLGDSHLVAPKK